MKLRVLIADDEPLARERLRRLLERQKDIIVVGECGDGLSTLESIRRDQPQVVLLDIQMPELDGLGVVEGLDDTVRPAIIFVTAHDRFAVRAFEVQAVDYLLKPVDESRLAAALERVRARSLSGSQPEWAQQLNHLIGELRPENRLGDRLAVKSDGRVVFVKISELDWIEACDNYVELHVGTASHLLRETLSRLSERLPSQQFLRISRSIIINMDRVRELQPLFHGEYCIILRDGTKVTLTRTYRNQLPRLGVGTD